MNHGVVMFSRENMPHSAIWQMAMSRGQFVVIYTNRRVESSDLWSSALVPTVGEPLRFSRLPDLAGNYDEYARFEPSCDEQFCKMCDYCSGYGGDPTVVLPSTASDQEAMRLLHEFDSIQEDAWTYYHETFYVIRRHNLRKPRKSQSRLSNRMKPIHLHDGWAYFLGFCGSRDSIVVFLSDNEADIEGLFDPIDADRPMIRKADWLYHYGVIEKW